MTPAKGTTLSHYRLEEKIGAGGMGEVWRAVDTTLDRPVAVKILPEAFAADPHRVTRFEREAKLLASLNHPNIAVIHGLHGALGIHFLAMELVSGEDLSVVLKRGAIPVGEAIALARQITEALEAAHDSGVVHRDLKPANLLITPDGRLKVLDFGLAKAFDHEPGARASVSLSPTMTAAATLAGVILGTAAYMSPEQARGLQADRRADIWAFGCVLYEMFTGRRPFEGDTVSDTLAAVLKSEPDWSALPAATPGGVRALLRRCLEKDPKRRLQAIGDARIAIDEALSDPGRAEDGTTAPHRTRPGAREIVAWMAVAGLVVLATALVVTRPGPVPAAPTVRSAIIPPPRSRFDFAQEKSGSLSMSPDGRYVTYSLLTSDGDQSLWIRSLDALEARPLPGTKSATWPFWSPDSKHIAFFSDGKLKRIDLAGSPATTICEARDGRGGTWGADGVILFTPNPNTGIFKVAAAGGRPEPVTQLDLTHGETTHRWASFLPDSRHFLYMAGTHNASITDEANAIYIAEIGREGRRRLLLARSNVQVTPGYLLYVRDRILLAQPFDTARLELSGEPAPLGEEAGYETSYFRALFAASAGGSLVYRPGALTAGSRLAWFGRDGHEISKVGDIGTYQKNVALSDDGRRVAFDLVDSDSGTSDIWILDLQRGVRTRLTFGLGSEYGPVWSPDGQRIVYSIGALRDDLFVRSASGGQEEMLLQSEMDKQATDWSADGRYLVYDQQDNGVTNRWGVWVLPLAEKSKPRAFVDTEFNERGGRLSPDSRWMLYHSDESGKTEVYVANFPGPGGKWQVSSGGAIDAWWTAGGREIVYIRPDLTVMSVAARSTGAVFEAETPRPLYRVPLARGGDVTLDGQRFLVAVRSEDDQDLPLTLVTNWPAALKH